MKRKKTIKKNKDATNTIKEQVRGEKRSDRFETKLDILKVRQIVKQINSVSEAKENLRNRTKKQQ